MRRLSALSASLLALTGLTVPMAPAAQAASCEGTYTIAVGGTWDNDSKIWTGNVTQRVGYNATPAPASPPTGYHVREGTNELNRLIRNQRNACPGQHVKALGYSLGAAVVHTWVTENWRTIDNVNAVLVADPKRPAGPGNAGVAAHPLVAPFVGFPLAHADDFYGDIPTVSICTNDLICDINASSGLPGYLWGGNHGAYSFNVDHYSNDGNGTWYNGQFYPR
ncbi:cutinase family protein [Spirillospora sp. NPDC127200]